MAMIEPLPDMTEEETRALEWFVKVQAPSTTAQKGLRLANYILRHRADLAPSPTPTDSPIIDLNKVITDFSRLSAMHVLKELVKTCGRESVLIAVNRIAPIPVEAERTYNTVALIRNLENALANGYTELGHTDIGDLLDTIDNDKE